MLIGLIKSNYYLNQYSNVLIARGGNHMKLQKGDKAIEFCLPDNGWERTCLNEFKNKKVVLYFYPEHDTWDNIKEACKFRDAYDIITKERTVVVGVSSNNPRVQEKFIEKHKLPFLLLSDINHEIAEAYGVWAEKQAWGKKYKEISRSTFIINEQGKIQKVFMNVDVKDHIDEVLYELMN